MRVLLQVLAPGVQHAQEADVGAEVLGIAGQLQHRFGTGAIKEVVDDPLVAQRQRGQLVGKREYNVEVGHRQ